MLIETHKTWNWKKHNKEVQWEHRRREGHWPDQEEFRERERERERGGSSDDSAMKIECDESI